MRLLFIPLIAFFTGCATITEDAMTPISLTFSDGSSGEATLQNKRGVWETPLPGVVLVRKSDDVLKFDATTRDGRTAIGAIPSTMGAKIIASAVFIDFGITDAITDKHRKYPASYVIPVVKPDGDSASPEGKSVQGRLAELDELLTAGAITEEEYTQKRQEILDNI